jgi:hypothetical protein
MRCLALSVSHRKTAIGRMERVTQPESWGRAVTNRTDTEPVAMAGETPAAISELLGSLQNVQDGGCCATARFAKPDHARTRSRVLRHFALHEGLNLITVEPSVVGDACHRVVSRCVDKPACDRHSAVVHNAYSYRPSYTSLDGPLGSHLCLPSVRETENPLLCV